MMSRPEQDHHYDPAEPEYGHHDPAEGRHAHHGETEHSGEHHGRDHEGHGQAAPQGSASTGGDGDAGPAPTLVDGSGELFERWQRVQAGFVDSPRESVHEAGGIVEDVLSRLSNTFESERRRLDDAWDSGNEPSTEELRRALRRYREFFERLLAA